MNEYQATTHPMQVRFAEHPVSGPSYRLSAKVMVVLSVAGLIGYALKTVGKVEQVSWPMWLLILAAMGGILLTTWYVLTGRTTVDGNGVRQDWMSKKEYRWDQIAQARLLRLPMTSRLLISTGSGPFKAIQSGCPELDEAFREITAYHRARALIGRA